MSARITLVGLIVGVACMTGGCATKGDLDAVRNETLAVDGKVSNNQAALARLEESLAALNQSTRQLADRIAGQEKAASDLNARIGRLADKQAEVSKLVGSHYEFFRRSLRSQLVNLRATTRMSQTQIRQVEGLLGKMDSQTTIPVTAEADPMPQPPSQPVKALSTAAAKPAGPAALVTRKAE